MRVLAPCVALLAVVAAGCGGTRTVVRTVTSSPQGASGTGPAGTQRFYGRIVSVKPRNGGGYDLRFDPAWFLSGETANVAQAEDQGTACKPAACPPVANDNYVIDEGHRVLTFVLPRNARGTVLARGSSLGWHPTTVSAARLAQLVAGTSGMKLFEPLAGGVWLLVHIDTVRAFAQQYHP